MVTTVSRNPIAVCAVSAVPMNRGSVVSLSAVEKVPESAMTAAPHTTAKATRTPGGATKNTGDATQQLPLTASAAIATRGRPNRSDAHPPRRDPIAPATPTATNVMNPIDGVMASPRCARPAAMYTDSHVHSA